MILTLPSKKTKRSKKFKKNLRKRRKVSLLIRKDLIIWNNPVIIQRRRKK